MNMYVSVALCAVLSLTYMGIVECQRSPYAGSRPIGYKDRYRPTSTGETNSANASNTDVINRFGSNNNGTQNPPSQNVDIVYGEPVDPSKVNDLGPVVTSSPPAQGTTNRLPHDAYGDQALVEYLLTLPPDQRPFWLLNYQAIEAHRNSTRNTVSAVPLSSRSSFAGK